MKKLYLSLVLILGSLLSYGQLTDLIISEYAEGSSNNKYIEIYNGTGATVDLSNYELWRISNGGTWPESTVSLSGMLADGAVIVAANSSADTAILNLPNATTAYNSATFFNGDDAVGLAKDNGQGVFELIDAVGREGADPGSGWDVAGVTDATGEHTLVRKASVCSPDTSWGVTSGTNAQNSQWIVYPQNTWTFAGSHTDSCSTSTPSNCAAPSNLAAIVTSTTADLSWTNGSGNTLSNIEWGAAGFSQGSGTLVTGFNQASGTLTLTGLMAGTTYDFYVQDSCANNPGTVSAWTGPATFTTVAPEPTNHVTNFGGSASLTSITLSWMDSDTTGGAQAPDSYLVLGSTGGKTISTPVDATPISDDTDFSDSLVALNVAHVNGMNSATFNNLTPGTGYDFEIYPYTNSGQNIDYKTSPAAPTASVSTNPIPMYNIGTVTTSDATTGDADSLGVYCKIQGIVYTVDLDGNNGYSFYIQDTTGGITVFEFNDVDNYTVTMGDEIRVVGTIGQFRGLTQFRPDSITVVSTGNALPAPMTVSMLDETTEGEHIQIVDVTLVDPSQWPTSNTTKNIDIRTSNGDTLTMRIEFETEIFDSLTVTGNDTFTVVGAGSQFDFSSPYLEGYQIFPSNNNAITITGTASCSLPFGLAATTTDSSATLTWNKGANNTLSNIEWGVAGFAQGSGTLVSNQASSTLTLNGLTTGTTYEFYVQDSCGTVGGFSAWVGPVSFTPMAPPSIPTYPIATVTTTDTSTFAPDSLGTYCKLEGIVTSVDFDGNSGYNFTIQDGTGGIYIYNFADVNNYQSSQGDELRVVGEIQQFRGLTQLFVDSITVLSTGNALPSPVVVTALGESTENELITIENAMLIDPWPTSTTSSANLDIRTAQGDTLLMRIDSDTDILDSLTILSTDTITITGVGGQFTFASVPNDGYQILPSLYTDIVIKPAILQSCNDPSALGATPGATDAVLNWTTGGSSIWNIEWGPAGFTQGSGTTVTVTSNPYTLTGLMTSTSYEYYVQDSCTNLGTSNWVGPFQFTTTAAPFIPTYSIATVTTDDANGEPDSLGVYCKLVGTVFSPDLDGNAGLSFYMKDNTGGINVFNFNDVDNYTVTVGDEIRVIGEIDFYNGLTELFVDSIVVLSQGNSVGTPTAVNGVDADTESEFIRIERAILADPSAWPAPTFNENLDLVLPNLDTITMRIDKDLYIQDSMPMAPTNVIEVTGFGGQFDGSAPYTEGYQIFPRFATDIVEVEACPQSSGLTVNNITQTEADLSWTSPNASGFYPATYKVIWGEAGFTFSQGNVTRTTNTSLTLTGLTPDTEYEFYVVDSCVTFLGESGVTGPESFNTLVDGINPTEKVQIPLMAFPNPSGKGVVQLNKNATFRVYDVLGQEMLRGIETNRFDATDFTPGVYFIRTESETIRLVIR